MNTSKIRDKDKAMRAAIRALETGGLVIYPTETCYGLGVDATNKQAVSRLLLYKRRKEGKAISIAVANQEMAKKYVIFNETARNLYRNFLPGPLTVVSKSKNKVATGLEAEDGTLGIRIPRYPFVLELIKKLGKPITSTSANVAGKKTPYSLKDVLENATKKQRALIDLFLDAGTLPENPPSTVVNTLLNEPEILRQGEIRIPSAAGQVFISKSEAETQSIASRILSYQLTATCLALRIGGRANHQPLVFALQGELGSGKTQFAKGIGKALGIKENISSPTFVLAREYPFNLSNPPKIFTSLPCRQAGLPLCVSGALYHLDTWRMQEGKELWEIGFKEMLKPGNVIVIEWLQKVKNILENLSQKRKAKIIWVTIETISETKRKIKYRV